MRLATSNVPTLNSPSRPVVLGNRSITIYTGEPTPEVALPYLEAVAAKTYTCQCCNKRVNAKGRWLETFQAVLTASKLCFDCHFWLEKLGDDRVVFIAGSGYALDKQGFRLEADLPRWTFTTSTFLYRKQRMGIPMYFWTNTRVWCLGELHQNVRKFIPDNAEWLCPTCLKPFHQDDGMHGYVCESCDRKLHGVNDAALDLAKRLGISYEEADSRLAAAGS